MFKDAMVLMNRNTTNLHTFTKIELKALKFASGFNMGFAGGRLVMQKECIAELKKLKEKTLNEWANTIIATKQRHIKDAKLAGICDAIEAIEKMKP